jgi:hypothetical protein
VSTTLRLTAFCTSLQLKYFYMLPGTNNLNLGCQLQLVYTCTTFCARASVLFDAVDHNTKPSCNPHTFLISRHYNYPYIYKRDTQSHRSMNRTARPYHDQIYFTRDNSQHTSLDLHEHSKKSP